MKAPSVVLKKANKHDEIQYRRIFQCKAFMNLSQRRCFWQSSMLACSVRKCSS